MAKTLPYSGRTRQSRSTSKQAAKLFEGRAGTARKRVFAAICAAENGLTDNDLQRLLNMKGSTERPRRVELLEARLVHAVGKRRLPSGRFGVVWKKGPGMAKKTDERETPDELFLPLDEEFVFDLDAAATMRNRKCYGYLGPGSPLGEYALSPDCDWHTLAQVVWLNCPYSEIPKWLAKAREEVQKAHGDLMPFTVVCLLPSSTSAKWFHDYIWNAKRHRPRKDVELRFCTKRYEFAPHTSGAKWPNCIAIFRAR